MDDNRRHLPGNRREDPNIVYPCSCSRMHGSLLWGSWEKNGLFDCLCSCVGSSRSSLDCAAMRHPHDLSVCPYNQNHLKMAIKSPSKDACWKVKNAAWFLRMLSAELSTTAVPEMTASAQSEQVAVNTWPTAGSQRLIAQLEVWSVPGTIRN